CRPRCARTSVAVTEAMGGGIGVEGVGREEVDARKPAPVAIVVPERVVPRGVAAGVALARAPAVEPAVRRSQRVDDRATGIRGRVHGGARVVRAVKLPVGMDRAVMAATTW